MKKAVVFLLVLLMGSGLWAQQKYALVIGNGAYTTITKLNNPVNDANDISATLEGLGFNVDKILNGSLEQMENAITRLKNRLSVSRDSYGFFFYAGHGVQSNGENYLIPVDANIQSDANLRLRSVSVQGMLDELNNAGNTLNIVILDACRDNPFSWSRGGSRGLSVVSRAPTGSVVMYATGANSTADDGTGRNGLFTGQLLNNLGNQALSAFEVFDKTTGDVRRITGGKQDPELSLKFSGLNAVYLGSRSSPGPSPSPSPSPSPTPSPSPVATYKIGDRGPGGGIVFVLTPRRLECSGDLGGSYYAGFASSNAKDYRGGGFNDWYLPSIEELELVYQSYKNFNLGRFSNSWYWSSSAGPTIFARLCLNLYNGNKEMQSSTNQNRAVAIRAF